MRDPSILERSIRSAWESIRSADALLIGAGAGMGVDSGLPDFRGNVGFWKAYPPFRGKSFHQISTPHWFRSDPTLAWGFFGHRLQLYRAKTPHEGFDILRQWGESCPLKYFVFTSNVDGHFQHAGFSDDRILECHGSIHFLQCTSSCQPIWSADSLRVDVDESTIRCRSKLPGCPICHSIARPNILMFGDFGWLSNRCDEQWRHYSNWLHQVKGRRVVVVEIGAGLAIPTVRNECELRADTLIRINPREAEVPENGISIPLGALEALRKIHACRGTE